MNDLEYIQSLVSKGRDAMAELETYSQIEIDRLVRAIAKYVYDNAAELAEMSAKETRMGTADFKTKKNQGKAKIIWHALKGKKSMGIISEDDETGIIEIAKPIGVVGAVQPTTNPQVTPMINACSAIKCKNAIIVAPHPRAQHTTSYLVERWREILEKLGAPVNLIQSVADTSIERTNLLMQNADIIVATGGPGMVRAAYSSGHPSFGVGQGNVQTIVDRDVDMKVAVGMIVDGRAFDNGIICSGEQTIITPDDRWDEMRTELESAGGYWIDDKADRDKILSELFIDGSLNKDLVGKNPAEIAVASGISIPEGTRVIVIPEDAENKTSLLRKEKMFPVITPIKYKEFSQAVDILIENLNIEGKGHSVSIHSNNDDHIKELGLRAPVSRVIVNQPCATTAGGSFLNGLNPTSTLGCGSWGNNSVSENVYYRHFMNITRVARVKKNPQVPSDEELWAEI
jgi:succinate-semialdehyde dehydrogenase